MVNCRLYRGHRECGVKMKVRFKQNCPVNLTGHDAKSVNFEVGDEVNLPEKLVEVLIRSDLAEVLVSDSKKKDEFEKENEKKDSGSAPENKNMGRSPMNKKGDKESSKNGRKKQENGINRRRK